MNKKHLLIIGGAALVGWFFVDTVGYWPGFKQVYDTAGKL